MDYYVEEGVRRAVAARELKLQSILAILHELGKPATAGLVKLDQLYSPKASISQSAPRFLSVVQGMSSSQGRARMPEIHVQPAGEPGQKSTVPLARHARSVRFAMQPIPDILFKKLCFTLHRGFVEARLLATHEPQQAYDLADAFEIIPGYLPNWQQTAWNGSARICTTIRTNMGPRGCRFFEIPEP